MILSKQKNLHLFLSQYSCVFSKKSACRQGFQKFLKKLLAQFISYLEFTLMGRVSWPLFIFVFRASFLALWWPNIWPKMDFLELFEKNIGPIHFIPGNYILLGWVSWSPDILVFLAAFSALWWPNIWPQMGFPELFLNTIGPIHFIPGIYTLMRWVSWFPYMFMFLASFSALWWPNIWPQMGFPELFEKNIDSVHFIPGIYPYGVNFLTHIHFRVPSLIFSPLMAKYLAENGVSGTFWKKYWLN